MAISLNRCIQDFPSVGWVRGNSVEAPIDIEAKIEKYIQEHTVSKEDIEALFADETIILDCGDASSHGTEKTPDSSSDTISLVGARTMVEELSKRLPEVESVEF